MFYNDVDEAAELLDKERVCLALLHQVNKITFNELLLVYSEDGLRVVGRHAANP